LPRTRGAGERDELVLRGRSPPDIRAPTEQAEFSEGAANKPADLL